MFANNKGVDQPAHPASAFVISFLKVSFLLQTNFQSVAEDTGLSLALFETPKTCFVASEAHLQAVKALVSRSVTRDQNYRSNGRPRLRLADMLIEVVILQLRH